jgi:hypothetical protein
MGWEKRGSKLVYYRKERGAAGRVRSVYCGSGERGELAAREDAERRSTRGAAGDATHEKKATADDPPAGAVTDGESPQTYSPENSPGDDAQAPPACSTSDLADFEDIFRPAISILYSAGLIDRRKAR